MRFGQAKVWVVAGGCLLSALTLAQEVSDTRPTVSLERKDSATQEIKTLRLVKTGPDDSVGFFVVCNVDSSSDDAPQRIVIYDTSVGQVEVSIDKSKITAPLADVLKKSNGDGHIEMSDGTAFLGEDDSCATVRPKASPGTLKVEQGKTRLSGSALVYDESDGLARIKGPIDFSRTQDNDSLRGSSESIVLDVDRSITKLVGNVRLESKNRVSEAAEVEYDDTKSMAILRGTARVPAKSTQGKDVVQAEVIYYNLENNEVRVFDPGNRIQGQFEDEE